MGGIRTMSLRVCIGLLFILCIKCALASSNSTELTGADVHKSSERPWQLLQQLMNTDAYGPDAKTIFEWSPRTIIAAFAACFCAMLANAAGIGGGPFYIPLFNTLLGFDLKLCTGLSHTVVAASAIGSCIYGLVEPSPTDPSKTLLNADIALQFVPAMLFGVSLGVVLNPMTPEWLQTLLLTILLLAVVQKTFQKGFGQWREERKVKTNQAIEEASSSVETPLLPDSPGNRPDDAESRKFRRVSSSIVIDFNGTDEHISAAHAEEVPSSTEAGQDGWRAALKRIPYVKLAMLLALWTTFLLSQLLKAKYKHCTWEFGAIAGGQAVTLAAFTAAVMAFQSWKAKNSPETMDVEMRKIMDVSAEQGEDSSAISSPQAKLLWVVAVITAAGFIAGLLGIGGALIFNPFLLALGVHPQVVASTAVMIILFGSSTISLTFLFNGMLNTSYVAVYAPIAFVSSLVGVTVVGVLVRRSGRASIIILLMACIIAAGTVSTVVFGGLRSYHEIESGQELGFRPFCT